MGSSPTLAQPNPTRELEAARGHQVREQRITEAQATTPSPEQAFDRLNPDFGVPPTPTTATDDKPCRTERRP